MLGNLALAQSATTSILSSTLTSEAICALDDQLLSISVGGQSRGDAVVKVKMSGERFFIESRIIQPSEAKYVLSRTECEEGVFLELDPRLNPKFDPLKQALQLQPVLELLANNTVDFRRDQQIVPTVTQPSIGLDFGIQASEGFSKTFSTTAQGYVGAGYASGALATYVGGFASFSSDDTSVSQFSAAPRATLRYSVNSRLELTAAYNAPPDQLRFRNGLQHFQGVRIDARSDAQLFFPEIDLQLPLDADIQVNVNGRELRAFRASAGTLKLINIPFQGFGASVDVIINDGTDARVNNYTYFADARTLRPGAYVVGVQAGLLNGQRSLNAQGIVGLGHSVTMSSSANLLDNNYDAAAALDYIDDFNTANARVNIRGSSQKPLDASLNLRYGRVVNEHFNVSVAATIPVAQPENLNLQANASYQLNRWSYTSGGRYEFGQQTLSLNGTAKYTFVSGQTIDYGASGSYDFRNKALNLNANANYTFVSGQTISFGVGKSPQGWQTSLSTNLTPLPKLKVGAYVAATSLPTLQVIPALNLSYQPNSQNTLSARVNTNAASASYVYDGRVRASLSASSSLTNLSSASVSGSLAGALSLNNEHLTLSQELGSRSILVKTGVAGIPLQINGVQAGVTDSQGNVLLSRLPSDEYVTVRVDVDTLPFNINVQNDRATLRIPSNGTAVLDWRGNITVSRYIQFFWKPGEPATYGTLRVGDLAYPLDDEGNGLIGSVPDGTPATLKSDDGNRSCPVILRNAQDKITCQP
ncbi:hypothetical protein [Deinococcus irradiatisoli]|uniref:hypothetical protein n=1 Tax=Deinococcus irradiatisoli TaxID=2202254 RepID=UPI0015E8769D|nr:hypothetical protein [Deinococcus irradiatisoli]